MKETRVKTLAELDAFARRFAKTLHGGDVVGLVGELGAGKTTFVQKLAAALGVSGDVRSPTFILMQTFDVGAAAKKRGIERICHVDAYRLKDDDELEAIGFAEYANDANTLTLVEWADRVPSLHNYPRYKELTFLHEKAGRRIQEGT